MMSPKANSTARSPRSGTRSSTKSTAVPTPDFHGGLSEVWERTLEEIDEDDLDERIRAIMSGATDHGWEQLMQSLMLNSCAFFAQEVLRGPPEAPYHGRFVISEHHEEWDELIINHDRLCLEAPRDHGKTFFFNMAYPIWQSIRRPASIGYIFSATKEQAIRILADIKDELENNPKLQHLVPTNKVGARWSATAIQLTNGSVIYARGFGTRVRGAHPHWIVVDDGLNDEDMYSEMVRRKHIEYFYSAISNMIVPGGQIIVIGTPFHSADLYGDLSQNEAYCFVRYQAFKKDGTALWPARYNKKLLEKKKREIGSVRFTREFMCEPISDEMSLFPLYLFQNPLVQQPTVRLGMPREFWVDLGIVSFYMGVDFALSSSVEADYTVLWIMGLDQYGNRQIIEIVRGKGLPYQMQLSKILEMGRLYEPGIIFVEANQAQRIFGDELIRTTDLPIKHYTTGSEKNSLDKGVPSLRVLLENGKFRIPRGDKRSVELTNTWVEEMRSFTWVDGKLQSVAAHDDTVMACWICDQAIRHGGFSFDFGEDVDLDGTPEWEMDLDDSTDGDMILTSERGPEQNLEEGASGNLIDDEDDPYALPSMLSGVIGNVGTWY
jgi:hypothetical protein